MAEERGGEELEHELVVLLKQLRAESEDKILQFFRIIGHQWKGMFKVEQFLVLKRPASPTLIPFNGKNRNPQFYLSFKHFSLKAKKISYQP